MAGWINELLKEWRAHFGALASHDDAAPLEETGPPPTYAHSFFHGLAACTGALSPHAARATKATAASRKRVVVLMCGMSCPRTLRERYQSSIRSQSVTAGNSTDTRQT